MNNSMTAHLKYAIVSYKKMGLIAKMVRGKKVDEILPFLEFLPKKGAKIMHKLIKSATANAVHNAWKRQEDLYVKAVEVGRGPKLKRMRFVGRARIHGYVKHRSFVKVILDNK